MQCPLSGFCISPRLVFFIVGGLGFALGVFSVVWPQRSIGLYQRIMERFNWKVAPINELREVRNTRVLGVLLVVLSLVIFYKAFSNF